MPLEINNIVDDILSDIKPEITRLIKDYLTEYMNTQPHAIKCTHCGYNIEIIKRVVDHENDIFISINPCKCQTKVD